MKKPYSLNYNIKTDLERLGAIQKILNTLDYTPSSSDLETFASYILYGKSAVDDKNEVERKNITDDYSRRYKSWVSKNARNESLDAILDSEIPQDLHLQDMEDRYIYLKKKPTIKRPRYDKNGNLVDPGDSEIPGMRQLWESIDRLQHIINVNEGKVPYDLSTPIVESQYRLYQLRHNLIDLRANQYFLKEAYRPTLHFLNLAPPRPQTYNWDTDSYYWMPRSEWERKVAASLTHTVSHNIADYRVRLNAYTGEEEVRWVVKKHHFDWTNYQHIQCLIRFYSAIYEQLWDNPQSWGRTLIFDFDYYATQALLSPTREYILLRRIDGATPEEISKELREYYNIEYAPTHIVTIMSNEIPHRIADAAKRRELLLNTPDYDRKTCYTCKRRLPRHPMFFGKNRDRRDNLASNCKECEAKRRWAKSGGGGDGRFKDKKMSKVQARETN